MSVPLVSITRNEIIFALGLGGILVELGAFIFRDDMIDPALVLIFAGMIGLPKVIQVAANNHKGGKE